MDHRIIGRVPLFAALPPEELERLAATLRQHTIAPDTILFYEGDYGDRFYIVLEGEIEIIRSLGTADERLIAVRGPGEFVGEQSLLHRDGRRTAAVRSRTPAQLLEMTRADFDALLHRHPHLAYEMVRVQSMRLHESENAMIHDLQEQNRRLVQALQDLQAAQAQLIEKEKLERELQLARAIQERMLPRALPRLEGFDFGALMVPAQHVAGDFFDFISLDSDRLGIVVADVCGHGVAAALHMALTRSLLRAEVSRAVSARAALRSVNRHLLEISDAGMFVTVLYGVLQRTTREFAYVRAGHDLPIVIDAQGTPLAIELGTGQPLGIFADPALDEQRVLIPPGGTLLLYTDGVTEAMDMQRTLFGLEQLYQAVCANRHVPAHALCDQLLQIVSAFRGAAAQHDDITLVSVRAR